MTVSAEVRLERELVNISYNEVLDRTHQALLPERYLEIGVQHGFTLQLALPCTKAVGVDPLPTVLAALGPNVLVEHLTSDEFFDDRHLDRVFDSKPVDLAFIDGLHLFEYALRDFCNVERASHPDTVVILDDCLPRSAAEASRDRSTVGWAGDVWRTLECLARERPDLDITVIRAAPTGLALIRNLNPHSQILDPNDQVLLDRYLDRDFDDFVSGTLPQLSAIDPEWDLIAPLLPASRQPGLDVDALRAGRDKVGPDLRTRGRRAQYWFLHTKPGVWLGGAARRFLPRR